MTRKKTALCMFRFSAVLIFFVCASGFNAHAAEWKIGNVSPETVSYGAFSKHFADSVTERTGGEITIDNFPSMQLGNNTELFEGVRLGVIEAAVGGVPQLSNFISQFAAFQLPFLFNDFAHVEEFFTGEYMERQLAALEPLNMKALAWIATPLRNPMMKNRFISTPEDLRGLKIRVEKNRLLEDVMTTLGANPVSISFGEVYTAMRTGVVDALVFEPQTAYSMKFYEVANHISEVGLYPFPGVLVVNLDLWNSLSEEHQRILKEEAQNAQEFYFEMAREEDARIRKAMEVEGVKFKEIDPGPFREASAGVYEKWMEKDKRIAEAVREAQSLRE